MKQCGRPTDADLRASEAERGEPGENPERLHQVNEERDGEPVRTRGPHRIREETEGPLERAYLSWNDIARRGSDDQNSLGDERSADRPRSADRTKQNGDEDDLQGAIDDEPRERRRRKALRQRDG